MRNQALAPTQLGKARARAAESAGMTGKFGRVRGLLR